MTRTARFPSLLLLVSTLGCRTAGLPAEPPERDPTNPDAPIPAYAPAPSPFETSAFPENMPEAPDEHEHHHHHKKAAEPTEEKPGGDEQAAPAPAHDHGGDT